jgi:ankyrin repeat protein
MPITYVRHAILVIALLLSAEAVHASNALTPTEPAVFSSPPDTTAHELLLPQLREAALQYVEPARPNAAPGRQTRTSYPLHWAAVIDRTGTAERLIDQGIPVDARDGEGRTPLMVAAAFDSVSVAKLLLSRGADPLARDARSGNRPLDFAAAAGKVEVAKLLLVHGARVQTQAPHNGETPLHYAALYGHRKVIALLVTGGADIDAPDNSGVRPLQYAQMRRQWLAVDTLLSLGARPDDLGDAVNAGDVARVQQLIAQRSGVNGDFQSGPPLHEAAATGQTWIAGMLLAAGADVDAEADPGRSQALHVAALWNRAGVAQLLIDHGADLDARDAQGRTPLTVAAAYGNVAVAKILLQAGSDPLAHDPTCGDAPIHWAVLTGNIEMVKLLLSFGVDVNARSGHDGESPLHYAVTNGRTKMVEFLVESGADPNSRDDLGRTPLAFAFRHAPAKAAGATDVLRRLGGRE